MEQPSGLNVSGVPGDARVVRRGAVHFSCGQATKLHAHHAWKLHIGLDAPVWLEGREGVIPSAQGARVLLVPPGWAHRTGAVGRSVALFVAPGSRGTPWRSQGQNEPQVVTGQRQRRIVAAAAQFASDARATTADWIDELTKLSIGIKQAAIDPRVEQVLAAQLRHPSQALSALAASVGLSLDRASHLVSQQAGITLRRHAIWSRVLLQLSSSTNHASIAAAAVAAGFSDHAHMTRCFRQCLGRVPSEFKAMPEVHAPW